MKIINLRLYYPHYDQDKLVEVSEEVFDAMLWNTARPQSSLLYWQRNGPSVTDR